MSGAERVAGGAASGSCYPREFRTGTREVRDSTIDALEQAASSRPRASRFRGSVPAGGRVWNLARCRADRDANFEPLARKMTAVRRSHLMHSVTQGFILTNSE